MSDSLPTGTVTFLFIDMLDSTPLWERYPAEMRTAVARYDDVLRRAVIAHHGHIVKTTGDGIHAVFASVADAAAAAVQAQRELATSAGASSGPVIRSRTGLHTGEAEAREGDYFGPAVNRAARIMSIAHGGQILLSTATAELLSPLPAGISLRDLGEQRLKGVAQPVRVFQLVAEGLPSDFPPPPTPEIAPGNLPVQLTSFIGRERELAEVNRLLASTRLLTLTGPGGTGKTRLSLQVAAGVQPSFSGGAWLIELAPLAEPALVLAAVAGAFRLAPLPGSPLDETLVDYLRGKQLLLILDNCEHLVEACARLAHDLLAACPRLTILASSREGLGVPGETTYHVPTLELPDPAAKTAAVVCRYDAADLFLQRARAAQPGFAVTDANAAAVAQIVRRLDGIPLAIELAAARVRMLSPEQIAARLDDRFRLLTGGSRTALPRQQTLRALIDWSYTLLSPEEAALFRRLGVFVGGWTLEAGEAVAGRPQTSEVSETSEVYYDVLDLLAGLVNKSLVVVDEGGEQPRYRYLETIRQYAREKLFESSEVEAVRDRHMAYFDRVHLAALGTVRMAGPMSYLSLTASIGVSAWIDSLLSNLDNVRAATEWAVARDVERGLLMSVTLALALSTMRSGDGTPTVREAMKRVEAMPTATTEDATRQAQLMAMGYIALGNHNLGMGDSQAALTNYGEAARLARQVDSRYLLAHALVQRSLAGGFLGSDSTFDDGEEAAAIFRELDDPMGEAQALGQMAIVYLRSGDLERAKPLVERSGALRDESNDPLADALGYLAEPQFARATGDIAKAEALYREGLAEFRRLRNPGFALIMESDLAIMLRQNGEIDRARPLFVEALGLWHDSGRRAAVAHMLENFAFLARAEDRPERAARLLGAADALRELIHVDMAPWERAEYERERAALADAIPGAKYATEWEIGRSMDLDAAVAYAVEGI